MGSTGRNTANTQTTAQTVPAALRLPGGESAETYFGYGGYTNTYTMEDFVKDSRTVSLLGGIDFARSGASYEPQRVQYEEARKRWRKQIQYNRDFANGARNLTSLSSNKLKTLYKSASDEGKGRIAAELNVRGFYLIDNKWKTRGGGR